jgi:hypothetical protein
MKKHSGTPPVSAVDIPRTAAEFGVNPGGAQSAASPEAVHLAAEEDVSTPNAIAEFVRDSAQRRRCETNEADAPRAGAQEQVSTPNAIAEAARRR